VVLGAAGGTGRACVEEILRRISDPKDKLFGGACRAVCRDPAKLSDLPKHPRLHIMQGDVTKPEDMARVRRAPLPPRPPPCVRRPGRTGPRPPPRPPRPPSQVIWNADATIFAASGSRGDYWSSAHAVDALGAYNAAVAARRNAGRLVLVSSMLVTYKNYLHPLRVLLNTKARWRLMDAKARGERYVRGTGVDYCIVRPGGLTDREGGEGLRVTQGDWFHRLGMVSRRDVAALCVEAMVSTDASHRTLEVAGKPGTRRGPGEMAAALKLTRRDALFGLLPLW